MCYCRSSLYISMSHVLEVLVVVHSSWCSGVLAVVVSVGSSKCSLQRRDPRPLLVQTRRDGIGRWCAKGWRCRLLPNNHDAREGDPALAD